MDTFNHRKDKKEKSSVQVNPNPGNPLTIHCSPNKNEICLNPPKTIKYRENVYKAPKIELLQSYHYNKSEELVVSSPKSPQVNQQLFTSPMKYTHNREQQEISEHQNFQKPFEDFEPSKVLQDISHKHRVHNYSPFKDQTITQQS